VQAEEILIGCFVECQSIKNVGGRRSVEELYQALLRPSKGGSLVALSLCRVFLRDDVAELTVVNVAVVFIARANVAVAL